MTALRKAAIVLLSLDKPVAAEVMSLLPKEEVVRLTMEIAKVEDITKEEQEASIEEFYNMALARMHIERGGLEYANELLEQSMGKESATAILEVVKQSMSSVPFSFLHKSGVDNLLTFLADEHPQTIALILAHLPAGLSSQVLAGLPSAKQLDVVRRIASMEKTSPDVVHEVERCLLGRMTSTLNQQLETAGGVQTVANMLNVADRVTNRAVLENLQQDAPELVEQIRRLMFVFDDLLKLDDKAIQTLLKEVETSQWAMGLKGASEELKAKIMGNLSQRAAGMLAEEMQYLGPVRLSDVEAAQQAIVDTVRRLEDAGEIVVGRGGNADRMIE